MADTTEKPAGGGMLDARKAKAVFVLGVGLYLLMTFWSNGKRMSLEAMKSDLDQIKARKDHDLDKPILQDEPQKPSDKAKDFAKLTDKYNALHKTWEADKKKFDDELWPEYQNKEWTWLAEDAPGYRKDAEKLSLKLEWAEANCNAWSYWAYVGRFLAAVLMLIGLGFTCLNGSEWERAAAIIVIGLVIIGVGGILGR